MKGKLLVLILTATVAVAGFSGCSAQSEVETIVEEKIGRSPASPIVMRCAHNFSADSPRGISYSAFEEEVEMKTQGAIDVEIYHDAQFGTEWEITDMVKAGDLECAREGQLEEIDPKLVIYTMPYLFESEEDFQTIAYGEIGEKLAEGSRGNNLLVLATGSCGGFRQFTNNIQPIAWPSDLIGVKMRVPPITSFAEFMEACGAETVTIDLNEAYMALKTGMADGQENPFGYIEQQRFYEVQEYLTVANYMIPAQPFIVNADWYDALSDDHQAIIKEAAIHCEIYNDQLEHEQNEQAYERLSSMMEVSELDQWGRAAFIESCQSVYDYHMERGYFTQEDLDEIKAALQ